MPLPAAAPALALWGSGSWSLCPNTCAITPPAVLAHCRKCFWADRSCFAAALLALRASCSLVEPDIYALYPCSPVFFPAACTACTACTASEGHREERAPVSRRCLAHAATAKWVLRKGAGYERRPPKRSAVRNVRAVNNIHHSKTLVKGSDGRTRKQGERRHVKDLACAG